MQEFFDNINYKVIDDLKVSISEGSRLSIVAATFSIYAFQELKERLLNIKELRFIFTEPSFLKRGIQMQAILYTTNRYGEDSIQLKNSKPKYN